MKIDRLFSYRVVLILVLSVFALTTILGYPLKVLAKEPQDIKIDCPQISNTLHFKDQVERSDLDYEECDCQEEDTPVSNTIVRLGGDIAIALPEDLADPNISRTTNVKPDKTENLLIGDGGKIFFWGPPWGEVISSPSIEYRAKLGLCDMDLHGYAQENPATVFQSGVKYDWQAAADYMKQKLSTAAKEIERQIAFECGAQNIVDAPKIPTSSTLDTKSVVKNFSEWITETFGVYQPSGSKILTTPQLSDQVLWEYGLSSKEELLNRASKLTDESALESSTRRQLQPDLPYTVDILKGEAQIKYPGKNEWSELKEGDRVPTGSTIFTGMDATTVLTIKDKGVVEILSFTEITISEEGLEQAAQENKTTTDIHLRKGEIEVNVEGGAYGPSLQVHTTNVVAGVRGTHFWVSYNKDKNYTLVGIYQGKVEVQAQDGKTTTLVPEGNKPGIVLVETNKTINLKIIIPIALVLIVGGILFIRRRK